MDRVRLFSLLMFSAVAVYPLAAQNENAAGADLLRSGLYDMGSNKAGMLEIPLGVLAAWAAK